MKNYENIILHCKFNRLLKKYNFFEVKLKDLILVALKKGYYQKDQAESLLFLIVLPHLAARNELYFFPQVMADRKELNVSWFFNKL